MTRLCFALNRGCPCNRRVMKPLGFCDQHREKPQRKPSKGPSAEYQRRWKAKRRNAGVSAAWEAA